jgi:hypothetical protein
MRRRLEDMEEKDDQPVARESWQRLLQDGAGAPSDTTDARIRAAARRPFARRSARWWLPASLAASFVLAFVLVQWQFGDRPAPAIVTESQVATPEPAAARDSSARDEAVSNAVTSGTKERPSLADKAARQPPASAPSERRVAPSAAAGPPAPTVPQARIDLPKFEEPVEREAATTDDSHAEEEESAAKADVLTRVTEPEPQQIEVTGARAAQGEAQESFAKRRSPEEWYAEIVALRATGRTEEADRELERLKETHPGWLERHLREQDEARR